MKYAHYDIESNRIIGYYADEIHETIPVPNIQISEEEWLQAINIQANIVENGKLVNKQIKPEVTSLEELKHYKINELNMSINRAYQQYLEKYPEVEVRSFEQKARESFLVKSDTNTALELTPFLCALVGYDKTKRNTLAEQVYEKVIHNAKLEAWGVITRDAIKAANSIEELNVLSIEIPSELKEVE